MSTQAQPISMATPAVANGKPTQAQQDAFDRVEYARLKARVAELEATNGTASHGEVFEVTMSKPFTDKKGNAVASRPVLRFVKDGNTFFANSHGSKGWDRYVAILAREDFAGKLAELKALEASPQAQALLTAKLYPAGK